MKISLSSLSEVSSSKFKNALWIAWLLGFWFINFSLKLSAKTFASSLKKRPERSYLSLAIEIVLIILNYDNLSFHKVNSGSWRNLMCMSYNDSQILKLSLSPSIMCTLM